MTYARLLLDIEDVPSGALIYILNRSGNVTEFIWRETMRRYIGNVGSKSLLLFPAPQDILMSLSSLTPVSILWSSRDNKHRVVNVNFGHLVEKTVPVFKNGKKVGKRKVQSVQHVDIVADSFTQAAYQLFFATLGGKLCRYHSKDKFEYLLWDNYERRFKTEIR